MRLPFITILAILSLSSVAAAEGIAIRVHSEVLVPILTENTGNNVAHLYVFVQIRNQTRNRIILPTAHLGPIVARSFKVPEGGKVRLIYQYSPIVFRDGSNIAIPRTAFEPVELAPGESLMLKESLVWPEERVPKFVEVVYEVQGELVAHFGFTPCKLTGSAVDGGEPLL